MKRFKFLSENEITDEFTYVTLNGGFLIGQDPIEIRPLGPPSGRLFYIEYVFEPVFEKTFKFLK